MQSAETQHSARSELRRIAPIFMVLWCLAQASQAKAWKPACSGWVPGASAGDTGICDNVPPEQAPPGSPSQTQGTPQPTGQLPGPVVKGNAHERPHLIELTAKNWRPLKPPEKFELFWRDLISPGVHFSLGISAAISLATDGRDYLGEGTSGFARRYGYNVADEANFTFVGAFLLPTIFHEDPRYIPLEKGSTRRRVAYALSRVAITKKDSGQSGLNRSQLLGALISSAGSNIYTPQGRDSSPAATLTRAAIGLGSDAAFNLFKEFWPDFARKIRLNVWIESIVQRAIRDVIRVD